MTIQDVARQAALKAVIHDTDTRPAEWFVVADAVALAVLRAIEAKFVDHIARLHNPNNNDFISGELDALAASLRVVRLGIDRLPPPVETPQTTWPQPLDNVYMLARREIRRIERRLDVAPVLAPTLEQWRHVLRICEEAGGGSAGILRRSLPTELTDGETPDPERTAFYGGLGGMCQHCGVAFDKHPTFCEMRCGRDLGDGFICVLWRGHKVACCGQRTSVVEPPSPDAAPAVMPEEVRGCALQEPLDRLSGSARERVMRVGWGTPNHDVDEIIIAAACEGLIIAKERIYAGSKRDCGYNHEWLNAVNVIDKLLAELTKETDDGDIVRPLVEPVIESAVVVPAVEPSSLGHHHQPNAADLRGPTVALPPDIEGLLKELRPLIHPGSTLFDRLAAALRAEATRAEKAEAKARYLDACYADATSEALRLHDVREALTKRAEQAEQARDALRKAVRDADLFFGTVANCPRCESCGRNAHHWLGDHRTARELAAAYLKEQP